jgi:hypothetical protein
MPKKTNKKTSKKRGDYLGILRDIFSHQKPLATQSDDSDDKHESTAIADIITAERQKRQRQFLFVASTLLSLCAIAAVAGFFYFNNYHPFAEEKVEIKISGPTKITSGEDFTYKIAYANWGDVAIGNAKIIIKEPTGFQLVSSSPAMIGHSFDLGTIESGQRGQATMTGHVIGDITSPVTLEGTLLFVPRNFNSEFSVRDDFSASLMPLPVELMVQTPENVILGENFDINIKVTTKSLSPTGKLKISLTPPTGLIINRATPAQEKDNSGWVITNVGPNDTKTFQANAHFDPALQFTNDDDRRQAIISNVMLYNNEDQGFVETETTSYVNITEEPLTANLIINGATADFNSSLGENLAISAVFNNRGEDTYKDLKMIVAIKSSPIDIIAWDRLNDPNFGRLEKFGDTKTITWSSDQLPELKTLDAKAKQTLNFSVPLKSFENLKEYSINDIGKTKVEFSIHLQLNDKNGSALPELVGSLINIGLKSNIDLNIKALYYYPDGTPIGEGPLPPKANQTTKYVVIMELQNKLHELDNVAISTTLSEKVSWLNNFKQTVGEINYNTETKQLLWTINRLPTSAKDISLTLQVNLQPNDDDIGNLLKILNNTTLTAHDVVTNDTITETFGIITTNLEQDRYAIGKGIVSN